MAERQSFFLPQIVVPRLTVPGLDARAQLALDQALQHLGQQTQTYLQQLAARVDELAGLRGTPTFYADPNLQSHQVRNLGEATADTDAVARGQTIYMEPGRTHFTASGMGIRHVAPADENGQVVVLEQLTSMRQSVDITDAQFIVLALDSRLTQERQLAVESGVLSLTDAGPNATLTLSVVANGITDAKLRQSAGLSVIARSANSTGNVADLTATANGQALMRLANVLTWSVPTAGKHSLWIPAQALAGALTNGATANQVEMTTNKNNVATLSFAKTAGKVYAGCSVGFPRKWNEGTLTYQVAWTLNSTVADTAVFGLQAVATANDDSLDVAFGTAVEVADAGIGTAYDLHVSTESTALTVAGSPGAGEVVHLRFYRDGAHASDNLAQTVELLGLWLYYTTDAATDD